MRWRPLALGAGLVALLGVAGCEQKLLSPADCPTLCPGGSLVMRDTVLTPVSGLDSSFTGYVAKGDGGSILASSGMAASDDRAIIRFLPRDTTVTLRDTARTYTVDSVAILLGLVARDTSLRSLRLAVYRLPARIDSTTTFGQVIAAMTDSTLIDSVAVPDTVRSGTIRLSIKGDRLSRVAIPAADSGVLAIGVAVANPAGTGVRLGSSLGGAAAPVFVTYARANIADTTLQRQQIPRNAAFSSWVTRPTPPAGPDLLVVGGAPSSRALIRFQLPRRLRDSTSIVRATLELVPSRPLYGLPFDPVAVAVRGIVADVGAKSPILSQPVQLADLVQGSTAPVRVEVGPLVQQWFADTLLPTAMMVSLVPEAASFSVPWFHSTRSAQGQPQLRVTYVVPFQFERP